MKKNTVLKIIGIIFALFSFIILIGVMIFVHGIYQALTEEDPRDNVLIKKAIIEIGNDLNEMREYVFLSKREYNFFDQGEFINEDGIITQEFLEGINIFTNDIQTTYETEKKQTLSKEIKNELLNNEEFAKELKKLNLNHKKTFLIDGGYSKLKIYEGKNALVELISNDEKTEFIVQSILGSIPLDITENSIANSLLSYLKENQQLIVERKERATELQNDIEKLWKDETIKNIALNKNLQLPLGPIETETCFEYQISNIDNSPLLAIIINKKGGLLTMKESSYESTATLLPELIKTLKNINGESERILAIKEKKNTLEEALNNHNENEVGIKYAKERTEKNLSYYDLVNQSDKTILGSIIFSNETGDITFRKTKDGLETNLEEILNGSKKKT